MKKLLLFLLLPFFGKTQCLTLNGPTTVSLNTCNTGVVVSVTATGTGSNTINSQWTTTNNVVLASSGINPSSLLIGAPGVYYAVFTNTAQQCSVTKTITVVSNTNLPTAAVISTAGCFGSASTLAIVNAGTNPPGGALSYAILPSNNQNLYQAPASTLFVPSSSLAAYCGSPYQVSIKDNNNNCSSFFMVNTPCSTVMPSTWGPNGPGSVCYGSSATLSVTGASSVAWSNGMTGTLVTVMPTVNTIYHYTITTSNGCNVISNMPFTSPSGFTLNVNTGCANVWPGDANSDGVADNLDVLELGIRANSTGAARSNTSNAWQSYYATAWTGTITNGKNLAHADCNGDGVVNALDMTAVNANFSQTHTFRQAQPMAGNNIVLVPTKNFLVAQEWNTYKVQVNDTAGLGNYCGLAFDISLEPSMIVTDSVKINYATSLLNNGNATYEFVHPSFQQGKYYNAIVRTTGVNTSSTGVIATVSFLLKNIPAGTTVTTGISRVVAVKNDGKIKSLPTFTTNQTIVNITGVNATRLDNQVAIYPNPVNHQLIISSRTSEQMQYDVSDVSGRIVISGTGEKEINVSTSALAQGIYVVRVSSSEGTAFTKVVVAH